MRTSKTKPLALAASVRKFLESVDVVERRLFGRLIVDCDAEDLAELRAKLAQLLELPADRKRTRSSDPATSHQAGEIIAGAVRGVQRLILEQFEQRPGRHFSARDLERLNVFDEQPHGMVRKRVSELASSGWLEIIGTEKRHGTSPATTYRLPPGVEQLVKDAKAAAPCKYS